MTFFSYLPLSHVFERVITYAGIHGGFRIAFFQGEITKIQEDIAIARPDVLVGVPRVYLRFYDSIMASINKITGFKRKLLNKAIASKTEQYKRNGSVTSWFYDTFVLKKIRNALGGKITLFVSAAAPIEPTLMDNMKIFFSVPFVQGYGQTETAGAISIGYGDDLERASLGPPMMCIQAKVVDVAEMNYRSTDMTDNLLTPRGELCVRGSNVTQRYFKDTEKTKEAIDTDGWLHTGDVAIILPQGQIKIIDRKKNIFKLQQGEYIAPEKIENWLTNSKWVLQIFVYGDGLQSYIIAIIIPKKETVMEWEKEKGSPGTYEELCSTRELNEAILKDLTDDSKRGKFSGLEMIKKIHVTHTQFTIDNGTLTPTLKVKRNEAKTMYLNVIKDMYATPLVEKKEAKKEEKK